MTDSAAKPVYKNALVGCCSFSNEFSFIIMRLPLMENTQTIKIVPHKHKQDKCKTKYIFTVSSITSDPYVNQCQGEMESYFICFIVFNI